MSYQTYTTEAFIIGNFANNTADKSFLLFTKRAGMLYASARSVREERSRQRYALQDFTLVTVSLIKGKTGWRVGSVEARGNLFAEATTRVARGSLVRLTKLIRRFVQGEEVNESLYDEFIAGLTYLADVDESDRIFYENVIMARLLYILGYIAPPQTILPLFELPLATIKKELIKTESKSIVRLLDTAENVSHL